MLIIILIKLWKIAKIFILLLVFFLNHNFTVIEIQDKTSFGDGALPIKYIEEKT